VSERPDVVAFAEKVLELLEEGRYTATYKYAVLLALMDLCLERADRSGLPPSTVTTRELARRVVELYWPHTEPYPGARAGEVLQQNVGGQAEIVAAIAAFRRRAAPEAAAVWQAEQRAPREFERLLREVEWKLVQMPLPRLQRIGHVTDEFIYSIHWDEGIRRRVLQEYWAGRAGFDNRILLKPGVGGFLRDLHGLLRPLIHRRWAAMVATLNRLPEVQLEAFLFGRDRVDTAPVRAPLWELQERRCFYCGGRIGEPGQGVVDHFVPWARHPDSGLDNLVVADARCNGWKGAWLAATDHLARWAGRFAPGDRLGAGLEEVAARVRWPRDPGRTQGAARSIYFWLPATARLWLRGRAFVAPDRDTIVRVLG
jgi:5-methylcytosine-specific restriction endonuclease McrA